MSRLEPWRVRASRHLLRDRWISVRADECVSSRGVDVSPYYVLEYPDWVHVVAISPAREILLVEQYRHGRQCMSLEVPAGAMESGDADPLSAAARELAEETGCEGAHARVVQVTAANPASHTNQVFTVLMEDVRPTRAPSPDESEDIAARWAAPQEVLGWACNGRLPGLHASSVLAAFAALGWISFDVAALPGLAFGSASPQQEA